MSDYAAFLATKRREWLGVGLDVDPSDLPAGLYPFQAALTRWALKKGRAALWAYAAMPRNVRATGGDTYHAL